MADDIDRANDRAQADLERALAAARNPSTPTPTEDGVCEDCENDGHRGKVCEFWSCCLHDWERREVRR